MFHEHTRSDSGFGWRPSSWAHAPERAGGRRRGSVVWGRVWGRWWGGWRRAGWRLGGRRWTVGGVRCERTDAELLLHPLDLREELVAHHSGGKCILAPLAVGQSDAHDVAGVVHVERLDFLDVGDVRLELMSGGRQERGERCGVSGVGLRVCV